jgi:hypothetical protein
VSVLDWQYARDDCVSHSCNNPSFSQRGTRVFVQELVKFSCFRALPLGLLQFRVLTALAFSQFIVS